MPDFQYNLLSVSKLTNDLNCFAKSYPKFAIVHDLSNGRVLRNGKEVSDLCSFKSSCKVIGSAVSSVGVNNTMIWHKYFGHAFAKALQYVDSLPFLKNKDTVMDIFSICPKPNITRICFPTSSSNSLFDLVHADVWGPYQSSTHDNKWFFFTLMDDHSRVTYMHLMQFKFDVFIILRNYVAMIETQFGKRIKCFRTNNGGEFF